MNFYNPVNIIFGCGSRSKLFDFIKNKKIILISSENGFSRINNDSILSKISKNILSQIIIKSNADIDNLKEIKIDNNIDFIVAIGGGSIIDSAKIIKHLNNLNTNLISIPTTSGSGSEVTPYATGWNYKNYKKIGFENLYSNIAIIDPELTYNLPIKYTISSGLDAINQAFESIWNINKTPITEILAIQSIKIGIESLIKLIKEEDIESRKNMSLCSLLSGICISQTKTSICHSISYPLTIKYGISHGIACAFTMPEVFIYNSKHDDRTLLRISKNMLGNNSTLDDMYQYLKYICVCTNVYNDVREKIKSEENLLKMINEMYTISRIKNNICTVTNDDIEVIVKKSFNYITK